MISVHFIISIWFCNWYHKRVWSSNLQLGRLSFPSTLLVALSSFGPAKALICVIWGIAAGSRSQLQPTARVDWLELGRVILKCDPSSACVEPKTCTSYNKLSYSVWMLERCLERCQYPCNILFPVQIGILKRVWIAQFPDAQSTACGICSAWPGSEVVQPA